ncbi:hypothetical protein KZI27_10575 [Curtobacterium sp. TC1]|uniref:hypothetical protein n=1 Tax=Curtobacterium sp. TC1 TaxID=2862880 RepID=UPI001C9AAB01|nr:hypothetical protein [Curtobacterium sp. TC1]QZQ53812.1 hypothetical protein KZI27_10575 [Curtobacterium sp. TC1]
MQPPAVHPARGDDQFVGVPATVADFWQFALGDLRMNNARGYLAEFLVAKALGMSDVHRVEWDAYDLLVDDRIRVEVKSSAYLQAWEQRQLSRIEFSGLRGTRYHPRHGDDPTGRQFNAHVYVFCVQTAQTHDEYRPLDVAQWDFHVASKDALERAQVGRSVGLATVRRIAKLADATTLRDTVLAAADGQHVNDEPWW